MRERREIADIASGEAAILQAGRNCWCRAQAGRLATIVDAADYFRAFAAACLAAERQILILGWDFDRRERLHRGAAPHDLPDELGAFLAALVKRKPRLDIYLLSWDFNMIYAAEREFLPALRLRLQAPRRLHFRLDGRHPKGASHHQKVVVVDDRVAFAGGIDLTRWRWDTRDHQPNDPRRRDAAGNPYPPFHDVMVCVDGEAAARLGDLARERWRRARGRRVRPPSGVTSDPWPHDLRADFTNVSVAISRTEPAWQGRPAVVEVETLYLDAIAAARRHIYIENQYFTSQRLADALAETLARPIGPEIVLVLPLRTGGWLEQVTMDVVRGRILERLAAADAHGRLRVLYPYQEGLGSQCIGLHAKLLVVDDRLLRIGSSNTSNRSMGLDTECDLAIESTAAGDVTAEGIAGFRASLLAEHLDRSIEQVRSAIEAHGGLVPAIEALRGEGRSLRPLDWRVDPEIDQLVPDDALIDPTEPLSPDYFVAQYIPASGRAVGRRRLWTGLALVVALLALAAAWRWTSLNELLSPDALSAYLQALDSPALRAGAAVTGFVIASLLMVPVLLLVAIVAIVFGGWQAFAYAMTGSLISAGIGFAVGRAFGRQGIQRIGGARLERLGHRLARRGTLAVAVLRMIPVAPFTVFNLVAGTSQVGARQFMLGTLLGMAPGTGAITVFSDTLWQAFAQPSAFNLAMALLIGLALLVLARFASRWLRSR